MLLGENKQAILRIQLIFSLKSIMETLHFFPPDTSAISRVHACYEDFPPVLSYIPHKYLPFRFPRCDTQSNLNRLQSTPGFLQMPARFLSSPYPLPWLQLPMEGCELCCHSSPHSSREHFPVLNPPSTLQIQLLKCPDLFSH